MGEFPLNNLTWANVLLESLEGAGVSSLCLSPGYRSAPIAYAAARRDMQLFVHFDERALAFFALGLAKATSRPVPLLVTSGTAVGNLLPAVMEAFHDHVPLIILSADRPPELRDSGANQTTDQVKIFASFVHIQIDLPCADPSLSQYLASRIASAVQVAKQQSGPVHINCMLRQPLVEGEIQRVSLCQTEYAEGLRFPDEATLGSLSHELSKHDRGIVICGQDSPIEACQLASRLAWPCFNDITSSLRGRSSHEVRYYENVIRRLSPGFPTIILQFGRRVTSQTVLRFCQASGSPYIQIDDSPSNFDPYHLVTKKIIANPKITARALSARSPEHKENDWSLAWENGSRQAATYIDAELLDSYSEMGVIKLLADHTHSDLFFGNSMPIRDAEGYFFPRNGERKIFSNRGLSGIDGALATCAGIASGTSHPLIGVVGDITFLHDLTSLALLGELEAPLLLILINNRGCGIFSFFPELASLPQYERVQACAHQYSIAKAAELFDIPHHFPRNHEELYATLLSFEKNPKLSIVEIATTRQENVAHHHAVERAVATEKEYGKSLAGSKSV